MNYTEENPCQLMICPVAAREVSKSSTFLAQSGAWGVTMCKPLSSTWATSLPSPGNIPFFIIVITSVLNPLPQQR